MTKEVVLDFCISKLETELAGFLKAHNDIHASLQNETKSSAGDKYETSREMLKQELEQFELRITNCKRHLSIFKTISRDHQKSPKVSLGSLVKCNSNYFFLSSGIGKVDINHTEVYVLSPVSPIGQNLIDKEVGDSITFMEKKLIIDEIH